LSINIFTLSLHDALPIFLNVQPNIETIHTRRFFAKEDIHEFIQENGKEVLQKAVKTLDESGVAYELIVKAGDPRREIVQFAKDTNASYIVMGTRGLGSVVKNMIGSISTGVLTLAPCPVLVVPE